jgi:multiple sugar transport system ATP-binding protein
MGEVTLTGVRKFFGAQEVIYGIDLSVADRELVVFVGPSGCGKSTLLRMIAGLEEVDYGTVSIAGRDVTEVAPARRGVAMVFQNYALYPHMTVFDNMAYGLRRAGMAKAEVEKRVMDVARMLQIDHLLDRRPKAMSGGQRQRAAIGRAIVREPEVFLFDEPLSNLDAALRIETRSQIARLHRDLNATMIFVTHDQVEAMTLADRIVVLNGGRIEQVGTPREVYHRPANLFVAGFIGSPAMNLLPATVAQTSDDGVDLSVDVCGPVRLRGRYRGLERGMPIVLGIRPEKLRLDSGGSLTGEITLAEHLGDETILHVAAPGGAGVTLKVPGDIDGMRIGERVNVALDFSGAIPFGPDGNRIDQG